MSKRNRWVRFREGASELSLNTIARRGACTPSPPRMCDVATRKSCRCFDPASRRNRRLRRNCPAYRRILLPTDAKTHHDACHDKKSAVTAKKIELINSTYAKNFNLMGLFRFAAAKTFKIWEARATRDISSREVCLFTAVEHETLKPVPRPSSCVRCCCLVGVYLATTKTVDTETIQTRWDCFTAVHRNHSKNREARATARKMSSRKVCVFQGVPASLGVTFVACEGARVYQGVEY